MLRRRSLLVVIALVGGMLFAAGGAVADVDGDGHVDAVFANSSTAQTNRLCSGDGSGGFSCSDVGPDQGPTWAVALGDVDGDGAVDAIFGNASAADRVCLGDGVGGFTCSNLSNAPNFTTDVALGDVDGDGDLDAVFATLFVANQVCLGNGAAAFTCSDVSADTSDTRGVALGYVDADAHLDAVFAKGGGLPNQVCLGDGTGGFSCSDVSADAHSSLAVDVGDVDGDGNLDAVFANLGEFTGHRSRLCRGDGSGGFACSDITTMTSSSEGIALGDLDNDTNLDVVIANTDAFSVQTSWVCLGDGAAGFVCSDLSAATFDTRDVAVGDVNADGNRDVVLANSSERNRVCLGDGTGAFACSDVSTDANASFGVALSILPDVPTPEDEVGEVSDDLEDIGDLGLRNDRRLGAAQNQLGRALDPGNWDGGTPTDEGKPVVFDALRRAVSLLEGMSGLSEGDQAVVDAAIDDLVAAARSIATAEIAAAAGGDPGFLFRANKNVERGDLERDRGRFGSAITRYWAACDNARAAAAAGD